MKKIIVKIILLVIFISLMFLLIILGHNELSFKRAMINSKYERAAEIFPDWALLAKNNDLARLYKSAKYKDISLELEKAIEENCNLKSETISEYCANIFYLDGLIEYRLGNKEGAIFDFTKVMTMSREDSQAYDWSKENIEFLQQKDQHDDENEQQQESDKSKSEESGESQSEQESDEEKDNSEDENKSESPSSEQGGNAETKGNKDGGEGDSRLPEEIQNELDLIQEELEQAQKDSQQGFNRSKSAVEQHKLNNNNLFNDPFFKSFFGKDNLNKNISDSKVKDW